MAQLLLGRRHVALREVLVLGRPVEAARTLPIRDDIASRCVSYSQFEGGATDALDLGKPDQLLSLIDCRLGVKAPVLDEPWLPHHSIVRVQGRSQSPRWPYRVSHGSGRASPTGGVHFWN